MNLKRYKIHNMRRFWAISTTPEECSIYYPSSPGRTPTTSTIKTFFLSKKADQMRFSKVAFSATLLAAAAVSARPVSGDYHQLERSASAASSSFALQNGQDAQALNLMFQNLTTSSPCNSGQQACVRGKFAQCVDGKFVISACASPLQCVVLPLVDKPGTRYAPPPLHKTGIFVASG